jgi:RimJ/RimL family protein N-acetyltransferase
VQNAKRWQQDISESLPWQSAKLRLRESKPTDAKLVHQILTDPNVMRFLGGPLGLSEHRVQESILTRSGWMDSLYIIETIAECTSIGHAGILDNTSIGEGEIDFLIALLPKYQSEGYGKEVLCLLRDRWITETRRNYCTASVRPENQTSVKILAQCGFRKIGEYEDKNKFKRDIYRFDVCTSIMARETWGEGGDRH